MGPLPQESTALPRELWLKRLIYRSQHRGCKETDLVFGYFCTHHLARLNETELHLFEALLEEDDADIWAWLTEKKRPANPDYASFLDLLRTQKLT